MYNHHILFSHVDNLNLPYSFFFFFYFFTFLNAGQPRISSDTWWHEWNCGPWNCHTVYSPIPWLDQFYELLRDIETIDPQFVSVVFSHLFHPDSFSPYSDILLYLLYSLHPCNIRYRSDSYCTMCVCPVLLVFILYLTTSIYVYIPICIYLLLIPMSPFILTRRVMARPFSHLPESWLYHFVYKIMRQVHLIFLSCIFLFFFLFLPYLYDWVRRALFNLPQGFFSHLMAWYIALIILHSFFLCEKLIKKIFFIQCINRTFSIYKWF